MMTTKSCQQWQCLQHLLGQLFYSPYSDQKPSLEPTPANPMRAAVGSQSLTTCTDPVEVCPEVWSSPNDWCTEFKDYSFGAAWDCSAGASTHLGPTARNGFRAEFNGVGAINRAPAGAVGCSAFDGRHEYSSWSSEAGTYWHYKHLTRGEYGAQATMAGVTQPIGLATVTGPMELCPSARVPNQGSGTVAFTLSANLGQHHESWLDVGTEPVCVPSWNYLTGSWVRASSK